MLQIIDSVLKHEFTNNEAKLPMKYYQYNDEVACVFYWFQFVGSKLCSYKLRRHSVFTKFDLSPSLRGTKQSHDWYEIASVFPPSQ